MAWCWLIINMTRKCKFKWNLLWMKIKSKCNHFHLRKSIWICHDKMSAISSRPWSVKSVWHIYILAVFHETPWPNSIPNLLTVKQSKFGVSRTVSMELRYVLQLASVTLLWLVGLNIGWDCPSCNGLWVLVTGGNFLSFSKATDSPLAQPSWQANCLSLGLCKETVKQSTYHPFWGTCHCWPVSSSGKRGVLITLVVWYWEVPWHQGLNKAIAWGPYHK